MSFSVKDIAKIIRDSKKQGTPLVVFTGAGCSKSAGMPLANELISEINKRFKGHLKSLNDEQRKDYGACMSQLVPSEQKNLIEKHIKKSKINWAHIALSSLLKNGYLGKVLTFNFDNILNRACSLDNFYPPTYDLKVLSEEYFSAIPNQSIIHLHGQWSGFQLANSDIDTEKQAEKLKTFIKNTINNSPTLFIGYSGGADAFFKLVEENFIGQHRLFWIDYSKEPNNNVKEFIEINPNHRNFIGEQDADRFLLELAIELKCFPTELFKDPIKHLKGVCEVVNQFPLPTSDSEIDILEDTKKTLAIADANKPTITIIKLVELLHAKKFEAVINQVKNLDLSIKPITKIIASAYLGKSLTFLNKNESQFNTFFNKAIELEPNFYQAYSQVAYQLMLSDERERIQKSLSFYEKCFDINSNIKDVTIIGRYALALTKFAAHHYSEDLYEKSFKLFENALKIEPDNIYTLCAYAISLRKLAIYKQNEGLFLNALEQIEKAIKISPNDYLCLIENANILYHLAKINKKNIYIRRTLELYNKVLQLKPNHLDTINSYANALYEFSKIATTDSNQYLEESIELLEKSLELEPENITTIINYSASLISIAKLQSDENRIKKSINYCKIELVSHPENINLIVNYGAAQLALAQIKNNEDLYHKTLKYHEKYLDIKNLYLTKNYSIALFELGKLIKNKTFLASASKLWLEIYNEDNSISHLLGCYYSLINDQKKAKEYLLISENLNIPISSYKFNKNDDLYNVRNEQWFIELLDRLKTKEEKVDKAP
ncbi:SIR2 family protein [Acinetobacter sp. NS-4]|uniref:SIR2 family protein n=1 Tax=Acinetobacter sp. NS-4 TaxID=3127956 RepID=UPI00307E43B3